MLVFSGRLLGSERAERCRVNSRAFPLRRPPYSRADFDLGCMNLVWLLKNSTI